MDKQKIFYIAGVIFKYVQGDLTLQEKKELEAWKKSSPEHLKLLDEFSSYTFIEKKQIAERLCGKENAYQQFCLQRRVHLHRKRVRLLWYRTVAAVVLFAVSVSGVLFYQSGHSPETISLQQALTAGESRAILTLADGQKMNLGKQMADTLVQREGILLNATEKCITYSRVPDHSVVMTYNQLDVPRKGEYMLVLADGTKVWLNSESQLRYPVSFRGEERRVFLKGEAYFEVARNEKMPFIVVSGVSAVQVLGTSFNVRAYPDEACSYTTLAEGRVRLSVGEHSLVLNPNEQGIVDAASGRLNKCAVDINLYIGWREGRFVFENQTLEEIMQTLSRWYDVNVFFTSEEVKEALFIGNLRRYDDFDKIIEMLEMTGVAHFEIKGNTIVVSK